MSTHIPLDTQLEIFKRLPVKSLIRFISVCKAWKSFIHCSEFIAAYSVPQTQPQRLLMKYEVRGERKREVKYVCFVDDDTFPQQNLPLTVPPLVQGTTILDSCHGLLCMINPFIQPHEPSKTQMAVLWNPAIRKSIVGPGGFHSVVGFGVCPNTKDPKLVKITYTDDMLMGRISCIPRQVMVFTLSSGEWRCLYRNQNPRKSINFKYSQTIIGQFIYWRASETINENGLFRNLIMSFDLSTDEFREIDIPNSLRQSELATSKLRESLVLLGYDRNFATKKVVCDVWMMEHDDSKAFTKLFAINAPIGWTVSGFRRSGESIVEMRDGIMDPTSTLAVYEPCSEDINDLGICGYNFSFHGSPYIESLLLLDHDDGRIIRS